MKKPITKHEFDAAVVNGVLSLTIASAALFIIGAISCAILGGVREPFWNWGYAATGWVSVATVAFIYWLIRPNE